MSAEQVRQVGDLYLNWQAEEDVSAVVKVAEVVRNDYNLSPSRYVASNDVEPPLPLEEAVVLMQEAEEARAEADAKLDGVMALGFEVVGGARGSPIEIGVCHGKRAEARCDMATNRLQPSFA